MVNALQDLTLEIEKGEVFGFLGPNGAGKSTTIKLLMGLIRPNAGEISIFGKTIGTPEARRHVGYLPENPTFYDYLSAEEYLYFVGKTFGMVGSRLKEKIEQELRFLTLWEARKRPIRGYSKGMVQRLGIAQVLLHDPDIYILDEPMSGLDPAGRAMVKEIILDLKGRGKTIFFSTHITADIERVCDRVGIVAGGQLKAVGRVGTLLREGIEGYQVQVSGCRLEELQEYGEVRPFVDMVEVKVVPAKIGGLMSAIEASGGGVHLIEPIRRDLEKFFLDVVSGIQS